MYSRFKNTYSFITKRKIFFGITNEKEFYLNNFQYKDGLNILKKDFDNRDQFFWAGGFDIAVIKNIFKCLGSDSFYLRKIKIPFDDPNLKIINTGDKWQSNMIILEERFELSNIETFKFLIVNGADVHVDDDHPFVWAASYGYLDIVKYLVEKGANIHARNDTALRYSAANGLLDIVRFLVANGANIHANDDKALKQSAFNGHLHVFKFLVENGANICVHRDYVCRWAHLNGHMNILQYMVTKGYDTSLGDRFSTNPFNCCFFPANKE